MQAYSHFIKNRLRKISFSQRRLRGKQEGVGEVWNPRP